MREGDRGNEGDREGGGEKERENGRDGERVWSFVVVVLWCIWSTVMQ